MNCVVPRIPLTPPLRHTLISRSGRPAPADSRTQRRSVRRTVKVPPFLQVFARNFASSEACYGIFPVLVFGISPLNPLSSAPGSLLRLRNSLPCFGGELLSPVFSSLRRGQNGACTLSLSLEVEHRHVPRLLLLLL